MYDLPIKICMIQDRLNPYNFFLIIHIFRELQKVINVIFVITN